MKLPTPAIVAQSAVRRLPRLGLWLLCLAYVLPGFIGREPWKTADMQGFAYMFELARGATGWLDPMVLGERPEFSALLPYWLGAWAIGLTRGWLPADVAVRLPYVALLVVTLTCTWHAIFHLARSPRAQPVAFAFGGEADPLDYARAMADAGLLALIACLGLAQFTHETTPSPAQLAFTAMCFYGLAALATSRPWPQLALAGGLVGLALSGAPTLALLLAAGGALVLLTPDGVSSTDDRQRRLWALWVGACALATALLAWRLQLWAWRILPALPEPGPLGRLLLWFTWPVGPLAAWTLWRWRRQLTSRHLALPLWLAVITLASAITTPNADRSLLLTLPALATLAAFALPTLRRPVAALIDWFTLLFFTGIALVIWVVWISLQTGVPAKPAANVARLAVGYEPVFSVWAFAAALAATLAWAGLVRWRVGRHRAALWKSLVLPAGGAALCWLLLMTLWLPVLDYARSYVPTVRDVVRAVSADGQRPSCVEVSGLTRGQSAALRYHGELELKAVTAQPQCDWRVTASTGPTLPADRWRLVTTVRRPTDPREALRIYRIQP